MIDYWLGSVPPALRLEILDAKGTVIKTFAPNGVRPLGLSWRRERPVVARRHKPLVWDMASNQEGKTMRTLLVAGLITACAAMSHPTRIIAQESPEAEKVEVLAAKAMLSLGRFPTSRIMVTPQFTQSGQAPGNSDATKGLRPNSRNAAIVAAINARGVAGAPGIPMCKDCGTDPVSLVLTMSDPQFDGDSAAVTVTAKYPGHKTTTEYETMHYVLQKLQGVWAIRRSEQLGVT